MHGPYNEQAFGGLRRLRTSLADAEDKRPYIVFGAAILVQMVREKPLEDDALLAIAGVEGAPVAEVR